MRTLSLNAMTSVAALLSADKGGDAPGVGHNLPMDAISMEELDRLRGLVTVKIDSEDEFNAKLAKYASDSRALVDLESSMAVSLAELVIGYEVGRYLRAIENNPAFKLDLSQTRYNDMRKAITKAIATAKNGDDELRDVLESRSVQATIPFAIRAAVLIMRGKLFIAKFLRTSKFTATALSDEEAHKARGKVVKRFAAPENAIRVNTVTYAKDQSGAFVPTGSPIPNEETALRPLSVKMVDTLYSIHAEGMDIGTDNNGWLIGVVKPEPAKVEPEKGETTTETSQDAPQEGVEGEVETRAPQAPSAPVEARKSVAEEMSTADTAVISERIKVDQGFAVGLVDGALIATQAVKDILTLGQCLNLVGSADYAVERILALNVAKMSKADRARVEASLYDLKCKVDELVSADGDLLVAVDDATVEKVA